MKINYYREMDAVDNKWISQCTKGKWYDWNRIFILQANDGNIAVISLNSFERLINWFYEKLHINFFKDVFEGKDVRLIQPNEFKQIHKKVNEQAVIQFINEKEAARFIAEKEAEVKPPEMQEKLAGPDKKPEEEFKKANEIVIRDFDKNLFKNKFGEDGLKILTDLIRNINQRVTNGAYEWTDQDIERKNLVVEWLKMNKYIHSYESFGLYWGAKYKIFVKEEDVYATPQSALEVFQKTGRWPREMPDRYKPIEDNEDKNN